MSDTTHRRPRPVLLRAGYDLPDDEAQCCRVSSVSMTPDGRVVVSLRGVLWGDETAAVLRDFSRAVDDLDGAPKSIAIVVNSPGGDVEAVRELHHAIRAIAAPSLAIVRGECCSAAYWIACAADRIVASIGSTIGNIGAYLALPRDGGLTVFRSAPLKGAGLDGVSDAQAKAYQAYVDAIGRAYIADAKAARPQLDDSVLDGSFYLAPEALRLGLIDDIA